MIITDLLNKDIEILEMGGAYPYLSKNDKRKGISDFKSVLDVDFIVYIWENL